MSTTGSVSSFSFDDYQQLQDTQEDNGQQNYNDHGSNGHNNKYSTTKHKFRTTVKDTSVKVHPVLNEAHNRREERKEKHSKANTIPPKTRKDALQKNGKHISRSDGSLGLKQPPFNDLQSIEDERRKILKRVELPSWRILFYTSGTCLRGLLLDPLLYFTMAIYIVIRIFAHLSDEPETYTHLLLKSHTSVLGSFLSFFLVLFVNQTNTRFFEMYGKAKACAGRIQDIAGLAVSQLPQESAEQIIRHINAAHIAGYVGQGGPYSKRHCFDQYNMEWNLISSNEMRKIAHLNMDKGGDILKELTTWCQLDVEIAKKAGHIDSYQANEYHQRILQFRASMDGIYDYCDQPPHFFYIHFLVLLSTIYLPIFAVENSVGAGWSDEASYDIDILNGLIVLLQCVFVIGLRLLGQKMVDPFGDDMEDLSVITYIESTLHNCKIILRRFDAPKLKENQFGYNGIRRVV